MSHDQREFRVRCKIQVHLEDKVRLKRNTTYDHDSLTSLFAPQDPHGEYPVQYFASVTALERSGVSLWAR